jgi:type I restriction enzyme S subunit
LKNTINKSEINLIVTPIDLILYNFKDLNQFYPTSSDNLPYTDFPLEIPKSWEWVRLGDVANLYTGNSINETEKKVKYTGLKDGRFYIATKDVGFDNQISYENGIKIPYNTDQFREAPEGTTLLCIEGGSAGRKIGLIDRTVCFGNKLCCFNPIIINNEYLYYYLQSPIFSIIFIQSITGIIGGVSVNSLKKLLITLPPINEQYRIVEKIKVILSHIDAYDLSEKELHSLKESFPAQLKKSILQYAVQGKLIPQNPTDEPANILLNRIREGELIKEGKTKNNNFIFRRDNSHYEMINGVERCIDEEIPFEIPESWEWVRLGSIGTFIRGSGIKRTDIQSEGVACIRYGEIYTTYNFSIEKTISNVSEDLAIQSKTIVNGDLLFTLTGENKEEIGKTVAFLGNEKTVIGGDMATYTKHEQNSMYLSYLMNSPYAIQQKALLGTGNIIVHISCDKLASILVPLPPFAEQQCIAMKINELLPICNKL